MVKKIILEAWHPVRERNAINEHIYIPDIYKALGVSHFIAEEGYSILTETFSHRSFLVSDNNFLFLIIIMPDYNYSIFKSYHNFERFIGWSTYLKYISVFHALVLVDYLSSSVLNSFRIDIRYIDEVISVHILNT